MGFLGGLAKGITNGLGITSSRDNKAGQGFVNDYKGNVTGAEQAYTQAMNHNEGWSHDIANQNYMQGAQRAYGMQQENYNQQQNAAGMLYNQATGAAPSAANLQMLSGLGSANNQVQSAMLSQQGGVAPGLSQRNMLNAQAQQNASIVGQGAALRAEEQARAQMAYQGALQGMGQQGANMAGQQMAMGQQQYGQNMADLNYATTSANNIYAGQTANASNIYNAQQGNLSGEAKANQAQAAALMNTASAIATGGASLAIPKPAA